MNRSPLLLLLGLLFSSCAPTANAPCDSDEDCTLDAHCVFPDLRCGDVGPGTCETNTTATCLEIRRDCGRVGMIYGNVGLAPLHGVHLDAAGACTLREGQHAAANQLCSHTDRLCRPPPPTRLYSSHVVS